MKRLSLIDAQESQDQVADACAAKALDPQVLRALVRAVRSRNGQLRRRGLYDEFDDILSDAEQVSG